jgi:hypothetical protein
MLLQLRQVHKAVRATAYFPTRYVSGIAIPRVTLLNARDPRKIRPHLDRCDSFNINLIIVLRHPDKSFNRSILLCRAKTQLYKHNAQYSQLFTTAASSRITFQIYRIKRIRKALSDEIWQSNFR